MEVGGDAALWVAVAAPVAVMGWSMWFAAKSAVTGPAWALRHLRVATAVLTAAVLLGVVAAVLIRPVWMGLAVLYPLAIGAWLARSRRLQLAMVDRDGGFGEIDPTMRTRVALGLARGLRIAGVLVWFGGLALAAFGVAQGWLVAVLGPVAVLTALFVTRQVSIQPDKGRSL
jgi:hypothetical protein